RSVHGNRNRATQRDHVIGQRSALRAAAMTHAGHAVIRVDRREHSHVMPVSQVLAGECIYVASNSSWKSPGVGGYEGNSHRRDATSEWFGVRAQLSPWPDGLQHVS